MIASNQCDHEAGVHTDHGENLESGAVGEIQSRSLSTSSSVLANSSSGSVLLT
jgi:hypothetical protein